MLFRTIQLYFGRALNGERNDEMMALKLMD